MAVRLTKYIYIVFVTGEDDIARFDSRRYTAAGVFGEFSDIIKNFGEV
jgi:hypothetical protein